MNLRLPGRIYSSIARHVSHHYSHDLRIPSQEMARDRSAQFVLERMPDSAAFGSRMELLEFATAQAIRVQGCFCEFGVYKGESLRFLAEAAPDKTVNGFDSFEGLPSQWRHGFGKSTFRTAVPKIRNKNVRLHVGLFEKTLPAFIQSLEEPIAFAHIDCDLYTSTRTVLDLIAPRLRPGSILLFDEYFNYPGWERHEHQALMESIDSGSIDVEYAAYNQLGEQVMVVVSRAGA